MYQKFLLGTLGIYLAYLSASILSERLYSGYAYPQKQDASKKDLFVYPAIVFNIACLICALYGVIKGFYLSQKPNPIQLKDKLILGFLYSSNALTTNYSLLFISYPTQTIGRNLRYLTVIIVGAYFSRLPSNQQTKGLKVKTNKIYIGILITFGVILFNIMKFVNDQVDLTKDSSQQWKGYVLLIISVLCDSLFTDSQAYSKSTYKPTSNNLYTCANWYGFIFSGIFILLSGTGQESIRFIIQHEFILQDIGLMCFLQLFGQNCIYLIISNFKQHIFPLISTTRKMLTVLLSIYIYQHNVNYLQWISIFLVFGSMIYEIREETNEAKAANQHTEDQLLNQKKLKQN